MEATASENASINKRNLLYKKSFIDNRYATFEHVHLIKLN